jgi:hypothetical protein
MNSGPEIPALREWGDEEGNDRATGDMWDVAADWGLAARLPGAASGDGDDQLGEPGRISKIGIVAG